MMYKIPECNFVITNVCNFDCPECNRFNNYNFSGHYYWEDNKINYQTWAKQIDIGKFTVLGGEPMANKDYKNWLVGLREIWPNADGLMITNGSLLKSNDIELYNILKNYNIKLEIGLHNVDRREDVLNVVHKFLKGKIYNNSKVIFEKTFLLIYSQIKAVDWPEISVIDEWEQLPSSIKEECDRYYNFTIEKFYLRQVAETKLPTPSIAMEDENGVFVTIREADRFYKSALIPNFETRTFTVHNNDPVEAHAGCVNTRGDCRQFIEGKFYKCSMAENLSTMDKQFVIDMPDEYRKTINEYVPANLSMSQTELADFMSKINDPIPQCSSCTKNYDTVQFKAYQRKTIFLKKKSLSN